VLKYRGRTQSQSASKNCNSVVELYVSRSRPELLSDFKVVRQGCDIQLM